MINCSLFPDTILGFESFPTIIDTPFLSPPVHMHGGLLCMAFQLSVRLCVTGPKIRPEKNSYLKKHSSYEAEISPKHRTYTGAF